tara:strand:- start:235 stop:873 length:639 start_codon:yes stop_codon:yes gene_type:complete
MKKIIITLLVMFALLQTSFVVYAEDGFSGFSGVRSNYMWRGYDQNRFSPIGEIQVQYDYKGGYVGVWAGDVNSLTHDADKEYDFYAGYNFESTSDWAFGVGAIQYEWSGEILDSMTEGFVTATYLDLVTVEFYFDLDNSIDVERFVDIKIAVPQIPYVDVTVEYGRWESGYDFTAINASKSFGDWNIGLQILDDAREGHFWDNAVIQVNYSF